uniref:Hepatocyte growth factor-regulated tyrosine kinase substrate n=1 Tax=Strigamia maritima TaxID=126957 RepID=T1IQW8_STRMM
MFRSTSQFDKLLEKSTSNLLLEPDWASILQLCDCLRQGDIQPKYAMTAIKKKFYSANPHVALFALQVIESCMKNCGSPVHQEVANKGFMEELHEFIKNSNNENLKNKILELIQTWAHAFRNEPNFRAVQDILNIMKTEGYAFPVLKETDAMFVADRAPEWADAECCHRCRVQFSVVQRKHHCRNCGQVFCSKCSAKTSTIPKFGIEKEVRVCDACFDTLNKPNHAKASEDLPNEYLNSSLSLQPQAPPTKTEQELQEEEEFQLALALSKSEAESKEKAKLQATHSLFTDSSIHSPILTSSAPPVLDNTSDLDPDLAHYLNRSYWEQKQNDNKMASTTIPSAPVSSTTSSLTTFNVPRLSEKLQYGELADLNEFVNSLKRSMEIFVNRMKSNSSRGRSIANDTAVQSLFMNITAMHSQLLNHIQVQEDSRVHYEGLQDKLNQIKDARSALDALREDHCDRIRREAEEAERQRQIQMAHKLEIMRKKKQEYLEYQRQLAMQRMQEQELEMQIRHEQKQQFGRVMPVGNYPQPPHYVPPQGYNIPGKIPCSLDPLNTVNTMYPHPRNLKLIFYF